MSWRSIFALWWIGMAMFAFACHQSINKEDSALTLGLILACGGMLIIHADLCERIKR